jgi:glycosyltransferase involved in cell wall biosynthesis
MEFMSQGIPVIASRTKIDTFYFDDSTVRFFTSGNDQEMAEAMLDVIRNFPVREKLVANGFAYVERHGWGRQKTQYLDLVNSLTTGSNPSHPSDEPAEVLQAEDPVRRG